MAENEKEKISFSLEMTDGIQNENSDNFFISGPIDIFATVDSFEELYSEEIKTAVAEALESDPTLSINVFVKNTFKDSEEGYKPGNLKYRGSYFQLVENDWQEVAIGTHVHDNKAILDKIPVFASDKLPDGDSIVVVRKNGDSFDFTLADGQFLPSLPEYIQKIIDKNKEVADIPVYGIDDLHHLDAAIDELTVTDLDDPDHKAEAYGHCQSLFDAIYKLNERLFLKKENGTITLETFNISGVSEIPYVQEVSLREKSLLKADFQVNPFKPDEIFTSIEDLELHKEYGDFILVYLNNNFERNYTSTVSDKNIVLTFPKDIVLNEDGENLITVLRIKNLQNHPNEDRATLLEIIQSIDAGFFGIEHVKNALFNIYIKRKITENVNVPKMYLTIDEEGNPVWDNKLLPANTFKFNKKEFKYSDVAEIAHTFADGRVETAAKVVLEDVIFDSDALPLIMFDSVYLFDAEFSVDAGTMTIWVPTDRPHYDRTAEKFNISVLTVFNGASGILENLASDYVSKTELVRILSRGKIDLSHYAKAEDLRRKADRFHTHSAYSNIDHTHDFRYADFHHAHNNYLTKAEYWASQNIDEAGQQTSQSLSNLIDNLIKDAYEGENGYFTQIKNLLKNDCGFTESNGRYYFSTRNIFVDGVLEDAGKTILEYVTDGNPDVTSVRIDEVLAKIISDLKKKISQASDITIGKNIVATLDVGGIKKGDIINANLTVEEFLEDLVHPYTSAEENAKKITPVKVIPMFFRNIGTPEDPEFVKIEKFDAALDDEDRLITETLYLSFKYENIYKEEIEYKLEELPESITLKMDDEEKIFEIINFEGRIYLKLENIVKMDHVFDVHIDFKKVICMDSNSTPGISVEVLPVIDERFGLKATKAIYIMGNLYKHETIKDDRFSSMIKIYDNEIPEKVEDYVNPIFDYYVIAYNSTRVAPRDVVHEFLHGSIIEEFSRDELLWDKNDSKIYGDDYDYIYFRIRKGPNKSEKAKIYIILKEDAE